MGHNPAAAAGNGHVVEQPVIGRVMVVTAPRFDGVVYRNAPINVAIPYQPVIGRSMTVTGTIFDGTVYRNAPIVISRLALPVIGSHMTVTAWVFDEDLGYHMVPVRVGGR